MSDVPIAALRRIIAAMTPHRRILHDLVNLPTAPFVEQQVIAYIRDFVGRRPALSIAPDRFGNLLVSYDPRRARRAASQKRQSTKPRSAVRPVLFAAHMDHPGFLAGRRLDAKHIQAEWNGWVMASFFKGTAVRFFSEGRWVRGKITEVIRETPPKGGSRRAAVGARNVPADNPPSGVIVRVEGPVEPGSPGMWDLPDAVVKDNRIHCRVCDDLAGLAAILAMLDAICRKPMTTKTYAFFTRAEEVGFAGALCAVADKTVPRDCVVVAVENSKAIAGVSLGAGPVLRVGDKASVFTPAATAYCQVAAEALAARDKSFVFQRKLMDGGTCESTAYCHYGYEATGICLPLGNYHNMDLERKRIAPEFVDVRDYDNLVKWFIVLAQAPATQPYDGSHPGLDKRLDGLLKKHRPRLLAGAKVKRQ